ncbi:phytase [Oleiharenicola lentus]|uniref:phytase n=1 Tax=Oleiharenicola lentus TaxID=2508720 RepID=UPI003F661508
MKVLSQFVLLSVCAFVATAKEPKVVLPDPDATNTAVKPRVVTEPVKHDTDDPAIWVNRANPAESLVLGTDKDVDGALYVFGLDGKIKADKVVRGLARPNNVDIAYDVMVGGKKTDIAVVTERYAHRLRVYRLPDMAPIDGGGIPVFAGEQARDCMGIALYTRPSDGAVFAIVSRSDAGAPREGYLHQYRLVDDGTGVLRGVFARRFGSWKGGKEIESIAVDQELGYVYFSDEDFAVRKYLADPAAKDAEDELADFGTTGFAVDREGISIFPTGAGVGYVLVSNQGADTFRIFRREGNSAEPHEHSLVASVRVSTRESDGSDITRAALPGFPGGLFVAMSTDKTFHFYAWDDLAAAAKLN